MDIAEDRNIDDIQDSTCCSVTPPAGCINSCSPRSAASRPLDIPVLYDVLRRGRHHSTARPMGVGQHRQCRDVALYTRCRRQNVALERSHLDGAATPFYAQLDPGLFMKHGDFTASRDYGPNFDRPTRRNRHRLLGFIARIPRKSMRRVGPHGIWTRHSRPRGLHSVTAVSQHDMPPGRRDFEDHGIPGRRARPSTGLADGLSTVDHGVLFHWATSQPAPISPPLHERPVRRPWNPQLHRGESLAVEIEAEITKLNRTSSAFVRPGLNER